MQIPRIHREKEKKKKHTFSNENNKGIAHARN